MAIALVINKILTDRDEKIERAAQLRANAIIDEWTKKKHPRSGKEMTDEELREWYHAMQDNMPDWTHAIVYKDSDGNRVTPEWPSVEKQKELKEKIRRETLLKGEKEDGQPVS
jgi:hypothetical protein